MSLKKNGFINLLFEGGGSPRIKKDQELKQLELKRIEQFVEESAFVPRNRLKHTRVFRISDSLARSQEGNSITRQIKKMFVDGSHLTEIIPRRQLVTQNYGRVSGKERMLSPEVSSRTGRAANNISGSLVKNGDWREKEFRFQVEEINPQQFLSLQKMEQTNEMKSATVVLIERKDEFLSLDNSTVSSSNKNIKRGVSVRYRKILPEKKPGPNLQATLQLKKELVKFYSNPFGNPENITAKAYILVEHYKEANNHRSLHAAFNSKINLQIASLTKIMTCVLTIQLCEKHGVSMKTQQIPIGSFETKIEGTVADIKPGQIYTVEQLLYGLMLPSGNDASIALSIFCGQLLQKHREEGRKLQICGQLNIKKNFYKKFLLQMNKKCSELQMKRTFFSNSHGLPHNLNRSCASDVAVLIDYALRNTLFRTIIRAKEYSCEISVRSEKTESALNSIDKKLVVRWVNTHRFVQSRPELYKGIKTGVTETAGPCLASLVEIHNREFIVVVLGCRTLKARYKDTEALRLWLSKKQQFEV